MRKTLFTGWSSLIPSSWIMCVGVCSLMFMYLIIPCPYAAETPAYRLDTVEVIADKQVRYLDDPTGTITVLTRDEFVAYGVTTLAEALALAAPVSVFTKGAPGSQADVSLRGSSNEGVLVLIDGVRVHDPQTGHFTLDLPLSLDQVERIEILSGGGSGIYGGAAPGGVINLVTGTFAPGFTGNLSGGSHNLRNGSVSYSAGTEQREVTFTLLGSDTDGFRQGTDRSAYSAALNGAFRAGAWNLKWNAGAQSNAFGADQFYGSYPSYEETMVVQGGLHLNRLIDEKRLIRLRIGSRGHDDRFVLIREKPEVYENTHYNRSTTIAAEYITELTSHATLIAGTELERFGITSGSLGSRSDLSRAVYSQVSARFAWVTMSGALRLDAGYIGGTVLSPSFGVSVPLKHGIALRFRADRSFRPPTYTERFYQSPANIGNPALDPEYTTGYETGISYDSERAGASLALFHSIGTDVIDWIHSSEETVWRVENHGRVVTRGVETAFTVTLPNTMRVRFSAVMLDQIVSRQAGIVSKYALHPLETVISAALSKTLTDRTTATVSARHERQRQGSVRTPVSCGVSYQRGFFRYCLDADNIFDERYDVLPGLPAHGRWVTFRLEYVR